MKDCNIILTKEILKHTSHEACEFCEETFTNKYDLTIHNASHIIIPLIKLNLQQCDKCLYFYFTKEELTNHVVTAHPHRLEQNIPITKKYNGFSDKTIKERVKYENDLSLHLLNDLTTDCKVTVESLFPFETIKIDPNPELVKSQYSDILKDITTDCKVTVESFPPEVIKGIARVYNGTNDSICSLDSSEDITIDLKVKSFSQEEINITNSTMTVKTDSSEEKSYTHINDDVVDLVYSDEEKYTDEHLKGVNGSGILLEKVGIDEFNQDSFSNRCTILDDMLVIRPKGTSAQTVPYDVLRETGIFKCQHCDKSFRNRLKMIKHETRHLVFKRILPLLCLVCDKYIAGTSQNLKEHIVQKHPYAKLEKYKRNTCEICRLPYRKLKHHVKYYHHLHCYICFDKFRNISEKQLHMKEHTYSCTTLQICTMCMSFLKPKINVKYTVMGTRNIPGVQQTCYACGKKFFEINLVKRHTHSKNYFNKDAAADRKKPITNEERLKNIQQRLKMMKV